MQTSVVDILVPIKRCDVEGEMARGGVRCPGVMVYTGNAVIGSTPGTEALLENNPACVPSTQRMTGVCKVWMKPHDKGSKGCSCTWNKVRVSHIW